MANGNDIAYETYKIHCCLEYGLLSQCAARWNGPIIKNMKDLIELLHNGEYSLVVANGEVNTFSGHGVNDLYYLLNEDPGFLRGASVADKVVGKAAAALMVLTGVREVYADIISHPALDLLRKNNISVSYGKKVPNITNRAQTDWCPLELRCREPETPEECLMQIETFMKIIKID